MQKKKAGAVHLVRTPPATQASEPSHQGNGEWRMEDGEWRIAVDGLVVFGSRFSSASSARKKNKIAAATQAPWSMSISADGALSSHIKEVGRITAANNPAFRPSCRWKYQ